MEKNSIELKCPECGEEYYIRSDSVIDIKPMRMSCWNDGYKFNNREPKDNKQPEDANIE